MKLLRYVLYAILGLVLGLLGGLMYVERYIVDERPNQETCEQLRYLRDIPQARCKDFKYD